ncbi:MAG: hypothetical protein PHU32_03755 [Candidatus ainarchaeum sp.]|nr:hypothetical protein [Candidatus ainarchaeum sp.]
MSKQKILIFSLSILALFLVSFVVYSWSEPTSIMPNSYTAPLNTSSTAQSKAGDLTAAAFYDYNDSSYYIDPANGTQSANIAGKIITETSTTSADDDKTLVTKDYIDDICILVPFNDDAIVDKCPVGYYVTEMVASAASGNMLCCKATR